MTLKSEENLSQRLGEAESIDRQARQILRAAIEQIEDALPLIRCSVNRDCLYRALTVISSTASAI
jgi:hypothetical protein